MAYVRRCLRQSIVRSDYLVESMEKFRWCLIAFLLTIWLPKNTSAEAATLIGATVTLFEMPVYYADWPQRRTATIVLELEPVGTILSEFREESGMQIIIRYPGGDLGNAWALEFQGWLVAFGVPSHYIILEPGSGSLDRLLIVIEKSSELNPST